MQLQIDDFEKVDIRVGTILEASLLEKARKPAYKMKVDFGDYGIKKSSAQITFYYQPEELVGKQVICVTNFPPRRIADWESEVLVTGFGDNDGNVILAIPERQVANGRKLY